MNRRPWLLVEELPPPPMADMNEATAGFFATIAAASCWWATISANETSCAASVKAKIWPVSSVGMKPVGRMRAIHTVSTAITTAMETVGSLWRMATRRVRSYAPRKALNAPSITW